MKTQSLDDLLNLEVPIPKCERCKVNDALYGKWCDLCAWESIKENPKSVLRWIKKERIQKINLVSAPHP